MNIRERVATLVKKLNEGDKSVNFKHIQSVMVDEASDCYSRMMKSLCTIKALKIEIDSFQR